MKVCVIGLGYIGLPTAAMFANAGHEVLGVDKKPQIVDALNRGEILIEENGLPEYIKAVVEKGHLRAALEPEVSDAYIISVPTPITGDKKADMRFVESATREIVPLLKKGDLVILESTSPVGTVDTLMQPILEESGLKAGEDFGLGHSPERVIPGKILQELVHNSRIAGGIDKESAHRIAELYRSFVEGDIYETDARTAEMCKLSENTFRDVNIAFANELAKICEEQGINVWELIELCNKHPRVNIHQPGPGVGGHCIAVDPWFIVEKEPGLAQIIRRSRETNDSMPSYVADRAQKILAGVTDPKICILGATYKPDVDDMRESPILHLAEELKARGVDVAIHDPHAAKHPGIEGDLLKAAEGADLVILGVNHKQFKELDYEALAKAVRRKNFLDTRNFADKAAAEAAGFAYYLLGK
jgi:UDP-N-acetyl-D-mannosaminuronic acid dehydrogenase